MSSDFGGPIWIMIWTLLVLWAGALGVEDRCLSGGKHKTIPSPEGHLGSCQLYTENACCSPDVIQDLSKASDIYWNCCGTLSNRCEGYFQQVECFYRCSPIAAQWPHPQRPTAVLAVPLCQNFCDQWYDACKEDLTCARNWLTDWRWGPDGNNCSQKCIPYGQMYQNGKELCETIWGDSFTVSMDPCECLTLTASDKGFSTSPSHQDSDSAEELETAKGDGRRSGRGRAKGPCPGRHLFQRLKKNLQKRSVFMEDVEGSGSGF